MIEGYFDPAGRPNVRAYWWSLAGSRPRRRPRCCWTPAQTTPSSSPAGRGYWE